MREALEADIKYLQNSLLNWFAKNGRPFAWRSDEATVYERVVSEILLQRTRAETVSAFLPGFIRRYPSWRSLAHAPLEKLESDLRSLGLWRQRAARIKVIAVDVSRRRGRFPFDRRELEQIRGVGQYVASAILLFRYRQPAPLLDTNMARLLERFFGPRSKADIRYDAGLQHLAHRIVDCEEPMSMNWATLDFAAMVCRPVSPKCAMCILCERCLYGTEQSCPSR
jgi:A/G-specific adenine glycosylase